jgi:hypothetical protein
LHFPPLPVPSLLPPSYFRTLMSWFSSFPFKTFFQCWWPLTDCSCVRGGVCGGETEEETPFSTFYEKLAHPYLHHLLPLNAHTGTFSQPLHMQTLGSIHYSTFLGWWVGSLPSFCELCANRLNVHK